MRFLIFILVFACSSGQGFRSKGSQKSATLKSAGWQNKQFPVAPSEFEVIKLTDGLKQPVWAYETPGGDILIAEKDQITILRDNDGDGKLELKSVFLKDLNRPFGMVIIGNWFYVATVEEVRRYPYQEGMKSINENGQQIAKLPEEGRQNHWMRNLITSEGQSNLYVTIGSYSDFGEHGMDKEKRRANILVMDIDGKNEKVFTSGIRNPVGMDWHPHTGSLWTVVNERDNLGDNFPDDYLSIVKQDHFYGWPYYIWGKEKDSRWKTRMPKKLRRVRVPHLKLGAHSGSFGLTFYEGKSFGPKYRSGAFISQYGSTNSSKIKGYKVSFVPFSKGFPAGPPEDFLTGFLSYDKNSQVYGRPAGLIELNRGELLVCDDLGNTVWLIRSKDGVSNY